ncbi:hypothetical protein [Aquimonas sp.]|jgi:hypothetical protein|uniref:hypothetical protein n=1 Tax=Aquimonas sp. TaxID=1872588 RepID=UPI0037BF0C3D
MKSVVLIGIIAAVLAVIHGLVYATDGGKAKAASAAAAALASNPAGAADHRIDALDLARQMDIDVHGTEGHFLDSNVLHQDWRNGDV